MAGTSSTTGFRHGLRVRMGVDGPKGVLLECERKRDAGTYWKVRLQRGDWVWPDGLIIDGPGEHVATCEACTLPFMSTQVGDGLLCTRCEDETFGTQARAAEAPDDVSGRLQRARRGYRRRHRYGSGG